MRFTVLLAVPLSAFAQTAALTSDDPLRGANLPPTSAALADEAFAAAVNPAGLSHAAGLQLDYAFERSLARAQTAHGAYLSLGGGNLGAALSADWVGGAGDHRRFSWALAAGGFPFSLGASYHWIGSADPALDGLGGLDLGVLSRPVPQLSFAFVAHNVEQPATSPSPRSWSAAIGLRPLGDRITLGVDYLFRDPDLLGGKLQYTAQVDVLRGLRLSAGVSHGFAPTDELIIQAGATLELGGAGVTYAAGGSSRGLSHQALLRLSSRRWPDLTAGGTVALFDLPDLLRGGGPLSALGVGGEDPFLRVTRLLEAAEKDDSLRGLVLKIDDLPDTGLAKIEELRESVLRLRRAGKKVVAVVLKADDPSYLLASAADRIYVLPQSVLQIDGLRSRTEFLGGTMQKLGVTWDVARVGAYKNSPDQLTRSDMSAEQKEALNAYLDSTFHQVEALVAPRLSPDQLGRALQVALISPAQARDLGLVDEVITPQALDHKLQELVPGARFEGSYEPFSRRDASWGRRRQIAVIPVVGTIAGGKSRQDGLSGGAIAGAETVIRALAEAAEDGRVAAIVLRVDSPGGDGLASDLMYRAVLEARGKKPVVASMGDRAASGGYYAAMGAQEIYASPATLTGSIGVFFIKPALGDLLNTLGVTSQVLTRGKYADFSNEFRPWTPDERQIAQRWVDAFYDGFITEAAKSRGTNKERIDAVARGRIWSGADAKSKGLVDQLGGLHDAIAAARRRAGIPEGEQVDLVELGSPHSALSALGGEEGVLVQAARAVLTPPPPLARLLDLGVAPEVLLGGKVLAVEPVHLTTH